MNTSGDAAEEVVHMSLEGAEVAAKISGVGAEQLGIRLYAALKDTHRTKGRTRLAGMLKSGKELKVYSIREQDLKTFYREARRYGVLYAVIRDKNAGPDAPVDIIARAEDASKIQRITERFELATVEKAGVNPTKARTEKDPLSGPRSKETGRSNGSTRESGKESVRKKLDLFRKQNDRPKHERIRGRGDDFVRALAREIGRATGNEAERSTGGYSGRNNER